MTRWLIGLLLSGLTGCWLPPSSHAAIATDCTHWIAVGGASSGSGNNVNSPVSLSRGFSIAVAGNIWCIKAGTYNLTATIFTSANGTASQWIIFKGYGDGTSLINWTGTGSVSGGMIQSFGSTVPPDWSGAKHHLEIRELEFDGHGSPGNGPSSVLRCQRAHHLRYINNVIRNGGAAGISASQCDYLYSEGNRIYHNGYNQGWASGITYNSQQWLDTAAGFHNYILNNIISGTYDGSTNHSDGNGIIQDLSNGTYDAATADTPPVLIAHNLVYQNGGRCIQSFIQTNAWIVQNSCYSNCLDSTQPGIGEIVVNGSKYVYIINNIAYAYNNHNTYQLFGTTANITWRNNLRFGGSLSFTAGGSDNFTNADPLYLSPPTATTDGYGSAIDPTTIGQVFLVKGASPAINLGIDAASISPVVRLSGGSTIVDTQLTADLQQVLLKDLTGNRQPQGGKWDAGAYEMPLPSFAPILY